VDVRAAIVDERRDLIAVLEHLDDAQWITPSLCAGWSVRDVVAHLVTPYVEPPMRTALEMVRRRSVAGAMQAMAARVGQRSNDELLAALTDHVDEVFVPPAAGVGAPLTDVIVHGADIRIPLAIDVERPVTRVVRALDFVTSWRATPIFLPPRRLRGVRLEASDAEWSAGEGDLVRGRAIDVLLGVLGRPVDRAALSGSGVSVLASRLV
jgi:uncharacterized protein (TIGR03083 family)